jgi:hypothetical protein
LSELLSTYQRRAAFKVDSANAVALFSPFVQFNLKARTVCILYGTADPSPSVTKQYVERLTRAHRGIAEVWLFGSRATDNARANSDWDYIAFLSDQREFNAICRDRELDQPDIDLFVVVGSKAMRPWPARDGQNKVLRLDASLEGLNWLPCGVTATYQSLEECSPGSPSLETVVRVRVAKRVHPKASTMPSG